MTAVDYARVQVRISDDTATWLADRTERMHGGSHHRQAKTELDLWRACLTAELRRIPLTLGEANCLADVLNATLLNTAVSVAFPLAYAECAGAFRYATGLSSYGAKWSINEMEFLEKLRGLGPTTEHALRDAVSRWWATGVEPTVMGWAQVGLNVIGGAETPS